ncbi:MAG TPA: hypothetical protein PLK31_14215 [Chloroflexota bacterium]|nr:hypothetical protein [Chloroflexota bacterium]
MMNKRALVLLIAITAITLLTGLVVAAAPALATPEAPAEVQAGKPKWRTPVQITTDILGGKLPVIEAGSDGRTVLVAYIRQMSANINDTAPSAR